MSYQYSMNPYRNGSPLQKQSPTIEEAYASLPESRHAIRSATESEIARESEGRGGQTRGWRALSPQRGRERHELAAAAKEQGVECFLDPSRQAYPICPGLRVTGGVAQQDCRGVLAAKIRAAQYHLDDLVMQADQIGMKLECPWSTNPRHHGSSRHASPSRSPTYSPRTF